MCCCLVGCAMEVLLCWAHLVLPGFVPRAAPQERQWLPHSEVQCPGEGESREQRLWLHCPQALQANQLPK